MKVAIILTVAAGDAKNAVATVGNQLDNLLQGVNQSPFDSNLFEYYRINPAFLPAGTEEMVTTVWIGIDPLNVPKNVIVELSRQNPAYRQVSYDLGSTRAAMVASLENFAMLDGATRRLVSQPGAPVPSTPAALLAAFVPFDIPPPPPIFSLKL